MQKTAALLTLVLCVACSRTLTREQAAELLQRQQFFSEPKIYTFQISDSDFPSATILCKDEIRANEPWDALEGAGLVAIEWKGRCGARVRLTDSGQRSTVLVKKQRSFLFGDAEERSVTVATRKLREITGVTVASDGRSATVEFTWLWEPTEIGKAFQIYKKTQERFFVSEEVVPLGLFKSSVKCQLWDDGWRCPIESAQY